MRPRRGPRDLEQPPDLHGLSLQAEEPEQAEVKEEVPGEDEDFDFDF